MDTAAINSTLIELVRLVNTAVDKTALARLKDDWAGYFSGVTPGTKLPWCDGVLTRTAGGASYHSTSSGPFGATIPFTSENGLVVLRQVPAIEQSWQETYPGAFATEDILASIGKLKVLIGDGTVQVPPIPPPPVTPPVVLNPPSSGKIQWLTTKAEAIAAAKSQNRKIFLIAGQEYCAVTQGMRDFICELPDAANPNAKPIKALIQQNFIPWFADIAGKGHIEYEEYAPSGSFATPLMCVIDSNGLIVPMPDSFGRPVKYINGNKKDVELYGWLMQYV